MYGMINDGIRDMVVSMGGADAWGSITNDLNIEPEGFEPLCPYDDSITYKLVELISKRFDISQDEVLRRYGRHWITYTASQGYGEIMTLFGTDFRSCLRNLNLMHAHMGVMMPKLSPPRFHVEEIYLNHIVVHYYSHRQGLDPMVTGLLEGLAEKYHESISVRCVPRGMRSDHDEFEVSFIPT